MLSMWKIGILSMMLFLIVDGELICPGFGFVRPQEPCVEQCNPQNDTCSEGKKCCYTPMEPCGFRCLEGKENISKRGICPSPVSEQEPMNWYLCDGHFCDVDGDCPYKKKCCSNKCGSKICISPEQEKSPDSVSKVH